MARVSANVMSEIRQHTSGQAGEDLLMIAETQRIRIRHRGQLPQVHPTAYITPTATLVGDVRVGPRARVMYGAVLDAEGSRIEVAEAAVICENAVLRGSAVAGDQPVLVGDHVFVGPHATLLGCEVGRCAYVATGATVLQRARLALSAHSFTREPFCRTSTPDLAEAVGRVGFAQVAFGVAVEWTDRITRYEHIKEVRVAEFGVHADDEIQNLG